jgi:hypothetical protein
MDEKEKLYLGFHLIHKSITEHDAANKYPDKKKDEQ